MAETTGIAWTDATWNPVTGCAKVSPGCVHCYSERMTHRMAHREKSIPKYDGLTDTRGHWTGEVRCHPDLLDMPIRWRKPRYIFVCSMSDLFHPAVPFEFIARVFLAMLAAPQHVYQVLSKRPERMVEFFERWNRAIDVPLPSKWRPAPLPGIWLGVSAEDQERADERIPLLLRVPAAVRFVSLEPLLGPVDLGDVIPRLSHPERFWAICGGESGPGARPMQIEWLADIVAQCHDAGIATFVKQDSGPRAGKQGRIPDDLWALKEYPT